MITQSAAYFSFSNIFAENNAHVVKSLISQNGFGHFTPMSLNQVYPIKMIKTLRHKELLTVKGN